MNKLKRKIISITTVVLLAVGGLMAVQSLNAACLNDPGNNNGDCTSDQYGNDFCEDSWAWHDCSQGVIIQQ